MKALLKENTGEIEIQRDSNKHSRRLTYIDDVNTLFNGLMNTKSLIEIKTCQLSIKTGIEKYPTRTGRFSMDINQHQKLIDNNGFYMFIVKDGEYIHGLKLIEAKFIPFRRFWQWNKIIMRG